MKSNPTRFWGTLIALGILLDILFWRKALGINLVINVALCLLAGVLFLRLDGHRPARPTLLLLPFPVIFALIAFLRTEPLTVFLAFVLSLFLMCVLAMTYLGGRWPEYRLLDYLGGLLRLTGSLIARPMGFNAEIKREQEQDGARSASQVWPVLRGILIALPILAIFAALLASADLVFSAWLEDFVELFNLENLPEYIFRAIYISAAAYALAGAYLHAASQSKDEKLVGEEKPVLPPFLGFTETSIVLGSVAALFTIFVAIQFQYFFGGQANIQINGYTYSEYARRGFGELVTVAFFSLLLILSASGVTRRDTGAQQRVFSGFAIAIVGLVLVMLVSAFQRLLLYEAAYGFSRLRTYTHVFIIWLALLLVAVVVLELLRRERVFALAALIASLGFALSLSLVNVDGFIVRQNVNRAVQGEEFDASYLAGLSDDAVPALLAAYKTPSLSPDVKEGLGAALACQANDRIRNDQPWQSFHLARWRAAGILDSLETDLQEYEVQAEDWYLTVVAPSGEEYYCSGFWD